VNHLLPPFKKWKDSKQPQVWPVRAASSLMLSSWTVLNLVRCMTVVPFPDILGHCLSYPQIVSSTSKPNAVPYFFLKYSSPHVPCRSDNLLTPTDFAHDRRLFDGKWDGYMQAPQGVPPTATGLPMHCPRIQLSRYDPLLTP
jgi:hypothetical protein